MKEQTIWIVKGTDRTIRVSVQDSNGMPIDLSGAVGFLTVKRFADDSTALISKATNVSGQGALFASRGILEFYLVPADTSSMVANNYVYDIQMTLSGKRYCVLSLSKMEVQQDVG